MEQQLQNHADLFIRHKLRVGQVAFQLRPSGTEPVHPLTPGFLRIPCRILTSFSENSFFSISVVVCPADDYKKLSGYWSRKIEAIRVRDLKARIRRGHFVCPEKISCTFPHPAVLPEGYALLKLFSSFFTLPPEKLRISGAFSVSI